MKERQIEQVALLDDPVRRRIYEYVRRGGDAAGRDEVAGAAGVSRGLAAFHLEKLLEGGLLVAHYARPPGRGGPGAGRSAKYYRASNAQVDVSLPERHYDLAGSLLVEAIGGARAGEGAADAAMRVAKRRGREAGERIRAARKLRDPGAQRTLDVAEQALEDYGYEPYRAAKGVVAMRNCPFHDLAKQDTDLVCSMNRSFLDGMVRGLGNKNVSAVLECKPGDCCVTLRAPARAR